MAMDSELRRKDKQSILLLPWPAHGHISPFLELAKSFSKRNFHVYFCSTSANLEAIQTNALSSFSIQLVELHLPSSPELPPHLHTAKGLPPHLIKALKEAFSMASQNFKTILQTFQPDLIVYDSFQPWAPEIASSLNIPAINYINTSASAAALTLGFIQNPGSDFPFPELFPTHHSTPIDEASAAESRKDVENFVKCFYSSREVILINSFSELEGKYLDYVFAISKKKIIPIGPVIHDPNDHQDEEEEEDDHSKIIKWLSKKAPFSTIFVSFGSEYFPTNEEMEEIANGLELSKVNFIWVIRFSKGDTRNTVAIEETLPQGFLERVGERALVVKDWAPQTKILKNQNIGGFVSHCGWNSVMESLVFGVPIIAMPMHLDQPINGRLVGAVGVGMEIKRDSKGKMQRHEIGKVIREVVVEKSGQNLRKKAREMSQFLSRKEEEKMDESVAEISSLILQK